MGFSSGITGYGATVFFNPVSNALKISRTVTSIAIAMTRAENTILALLIGYVVDKFGPRPPIIFGMILMALGLILFGIYANSLLLFVVTWTFMVALGASIGGFAPNWATINNWFERKKGRAMGIGMAAQSMGGVIMAPLLAVMIYNWGWRVAAVVSGILVALVVLPVTKIIRTRPQDMGLQPDGYTNLRPEARSSSMGTETSSHQDNIGVVSTKDFSIRHATKTSAFWFLFGGYSVRQMGQSGIMLHISPLLQEIYGVSPVEAGGLVGLIALIGVFGAIIGGTAGDRYHKRVIMSIIVAIEVVALGLVLTGVHASLYIFILGFGFGQGAHAINRAILGEYFGHSHYARLWGIIGMAAAPMAVVGPIFTGWLSETSGSYLGVIRIFMFLYAGSSILYLNCKPPSLDRVLKLSNN